MMDAPRARLRMTFTEDAELYDRARPLYPPRLFEDLAAFAGLRPGGRVLEIGPGTGQATVSLAERGYRVIAVELGVEMAVLARRKLARFGDVEVVTAAFEDWRLPAEPFDAVFAATAFHWVDPAVRVSKAAAALRAGGVLATVATHHIAGGSERFFAEVQECYERFDPRTPPGLRLPSDIPHDDEPLPGFEPPVFHRYDWESTYTSAEYTDVLSTYSSHRVLAPEARAGLLGCVAELIDGGYGGRITKRYRTELRLARRA